MAVFINQMNADHAMQGKTWDQSASVIMSNAIARVSASETRRLSMPSASAISFWFMYRRLRIDRLDNAGILLVLDPVEFPLALDQEGPSILHRVISPCAELSALDRRNPRLLQLQHERKRHCSCRVLVTEAIRQGSEVVEYDQRDPRSNAVLNALVPQSPSRPLQ